MHDDEDSETGTKFFRCVTCRTVVSPWDIEQHKGCPKCAGARIRPTNLGWLEKAVQVARHPRVWAWPE